MKKLLLTLGITGLMAVNSHATLVLSNSFGYADGSLVTVSVGSPLGVWNTHSGTAGQVDVASGVVNLDQLQGEDVNTLVTNATFLTPFTDQTLYASFKINVSTVPTLAGNYFAHFKDSGTGFRCRVFALATGAAVGKYRLGIGNYSVASANAVITTDLDPGTEYKVVIRHEGRTNSTIWISPTSEASVVNRADAADTTTNTYTGTHSFALRQGGNTQGNCSIDDLLIGTAFSDVQTIGGPPAISGLVNVSIPANTDTGAMPFLISDVETPAGSLTLTATSSNPTLVPNAPANLTFGGANANRTLTVTPASGQQGTASIAVVVTDGNSETATNTFTITVGSPTISTIANQVAPVNTVSGPIAFTVNDNETAPGSLTVTATSSDQAVLPDANISIANLGGQNRTITFTSAAAGVATITVTVADGTFNIPTTFTLTAYPLLGLVLGDDFSYPDGSIKTNSFDFWERHSGFTGQTQVVNGKLLLVNSQSEDINAFLTNNPYAPSGGYVFYARYIVNFSALPTANGVGEYFAHFKEFGTSQFRARIFSTTNGAPAGQFRIAIANGGFATTVFPFDMDINKPYVIISRYNVGTGESKLWINPASEASTSVSATDLTTTTTIYSYAFRQEPGIGSLSVDDIRIGTSFSDVFTSVVPTAEPLNIQVVGSDAVLTWATAAFGLQSAPVVTGPYANVTGATSPHTNAISGSEKYFRLKY